LGSYAGRPRLVDVAHGAEVHQRARDVRPAERAARRVTRDRVDRDRDPVRLQVRDDACAAAHARSAQLDEPSAQRRVLEVEAEAEHVHRARAVRFVHRELDAREHLDAAALALGARLRDPLDRIVVGEREASDSVR
jgi:hypothetical protein